MDMGKYASLLFGLTLLVVELLYETVDSLLKNPPGPPEHFDTSVDSISRVLGYTNYQNFRVLATPMAARELSRRSVRVAAILGEDTGH
jgi:hypothetical protein